MAATAPAQGRWTPAPKALSRERVRALVESEMTQRQAKPLEVPDSKDDEQGRATLPFFISGVGRIERVPAAAAPPKSATFHRCELCSQGSC